jgi:hypothetical protein
MYNRVHLALLSKAARIAMRNPTSVALIIGCCATPMLATTTIPRMTSNNLLAGSRAFITFSFFDLAAGSGMLRQTLHGFAMCTAIPAPLRVLHQRGGRESVIVGFGGTVAVPDARADGQNCRSFPSLNM